ncbi:MAG: hypothetical protein ACRD0M_06035, partial [Acidimicrobiales bacterium]
MPAVVVASLPFIFILLRRPVLRRLAIRHIRRRPREVALILLGALLGTAIITGSAVVGDTLRASIRRGVFTQLGPVDEVVVTAGLAVPDELRAAVAAAAPDDVDGVLPLVMAGAAVATTRPAPKAEPRTSVIEVNFALARAFGGDPEATGIDGPTPATGFAVATDDLAATLDIEPGDEVDIHAYGSTTRVTVERFLPRLGVAGLRLGPGGSSPNLFVAPGTIASLGAAGRAAGAPPTAMVAVSNRGGV